MVDISVKYLGLELKSPFIAASSGYTYDLEKIVALAKSGVGAVVLKSLFEEQISNEINYLEEVSADYTENQDFLQHYVKEHSLGKYVQLIRDAKRDAGIPIIASINCYSLNNWTEFAKEIEKAGADALEVNIYNIPLSGSKSSTDIEAEYYKIVKSVSEGIRIPVAVKIADSFTNLGNFISGLQGHGAKGAVLFNRFYTPDISLKSLKIVPATPFSCKAEYLKELRWIALLSPAMRNFSLSASTGVYDPSSGIKLILAGADTVQLCSVLYKQGPFVVQDFNRELKEFMKSKGFKKISDFKGMLNYANISNPQAFERVQFLKTAEQYSKEVK
jgi:dihydroorotate dehydrogenase (fumarate)